MADTSSFAFADREPDALAHTEPDAVADSIADAIADASSYFRSECAWIPSRLLLRARLLPNPRSVLQWHPAVCAV